MLTTLLMGYSINRSNRAIGQSGKLRAGLRRAEEAAARAKRAAASLRGYGRCHDARDDDRRRCARQSIDYEQGMCSDMKFENR